MEDPLCLKKYKPNCKKNITKQRKNNSIMLRFERRDEDSHSQILTNNLPRWSIAGVPLIPFPIDIETVGLKNHIIPKKVARESVFPFYNMPQLRTVILLYGRS